MLLLKILTLVVIAGLVVLGYFLFQINSKLEKMVK